MTAHRERYQNYIFKLLDFFRLSLIFFFFFFIEILQPTPQTAGRVWSALFIWKHWYI